VVPLYRLGVVSYERSIETLSVKPTVFEVFDFKKANLENRVMGPSRSLEMTCHHAIDVL